MNIKYLFVKAEEFEDYRITANKQNRIHQFWVSIIKEMPTDIKKEVKSKLTDLRLKGVEGKYSITGVKPYQFITRSGSEKLQAFLDKYAVFVEANTKETFKWKEDVKNLLTQKGLE